MKINHQYLISILVVVFLLSCNLSAQAGISARTVGLGDEFAALTGSEALSANPAAVNVTTEGFNLEVNLGGSFWNNLLVNDYLDEETKDRILSKIDDSGFLLNSTGSLEGRLTIGPVTGFVGLQGLTMVRLSSDLADLMLKGNEIGREYRLDSTAGFGVGFLDTGINLSWQLPERSADSKRTYLGMSYHFLTGSMGTVKAAGSFQVDYGENNEPVFDGSSGEFMAIYPEMDDLADAARGSAFDLGLYTEINETYSLGISILNIGGKLAVDEARYYKYDIVYEDQDNDGEEEWGLVEEPEEGLVPEGLEVELPLVIRLGGKMKVGDNLLLLANYTNTQYSEEIFGSAISDNKIALAMEWGVLKYLPLRLGVNYSTLHHNLALAAGVGLHLGALQIDLGISDLTGLFYQSHGISGALSTRLEF